MKILIIEDSERLRRSLAHGLQKLGHVVDVVADGREGLDHALLYDYDALILDLMLPSMSGLAVLQELRTRGRQIHVLILSARGQVDDRIRGLQFGADDYLAKPFSFEELCARLNALSRRKFQSKNPEIEIGPLRLNTSLRTVWVDDRAVLLTAGEYAILERLAVNRGRVLSKAQLLTAVHNSESCAGPNVVEVMICNLRRKLGSDAARARIQTRRGQGYIVE